MDQILNRLQANQRVLFVWNGQPVERENFQLTVEKIQEKCGIENKVCVEHLNRLGMANYEKSSFDVIISNALVSNDDTLNNHDSKTLAEFLRLLKPKGVYFKLNSPILTSAAQKLSNLIIGPKFLKFETLKLGK